MLRSGKQAKFINQNTVPLKFVYTGAYEGEGESDCVSDVLGEVH